MLSPPNFSIIADAISNAATASATTPAAGTAQTSERSTLALKGFLLKMSTERSGFMSVGMGFMAARSTMFSPLLMPALDAACHVRLAVESGLPAPEDLVMHQGARTVRHAEAGADLDALDRLYAHDRGGKPAVELPVPVHMAAEPYGNTCDDQFENTAQGISGGLRLIDLPHHPLFRLRIGTAQL